MKQRTDAERAFNQAARDYSLEPRHIRTARAIRRYRPEASGRADIAGLPAVLAWVLRSGSVPVGPCATRVIPEEELDTAWQPAAVTRQHLESAPRVRRYGFP